MFNEYISTLIIKNIEEGKTLYTTEYNINNIETFQSLDTYTFYKLHIEIDKPLKETLAIIKEKDILNLYIINTCKNKTSTYQTTINVQNISSNDNNTLLEILTTGISTYVLAKH